jgi:hypothetical protein
LQWHLSVERVPELTLPHIIALICVVALGAVVVQQIRRRRKLRALAAQISALRSSQGQRIQYRPMGASESPSGGFRAILDEATDVLKQNGLTVLGDLIEEDHSGKSRGPTRWFVDHDQTTCGWVAALPTPQGIQPVAFFFSEVSSREWVVTHMGPTSIRLSTPAFVNRTDYPSTDGLTGAFTGHRKALSSRSDQGDLRRAAGLPEAVALVERFRKAITDWRASQRADELLAQDLRSILQNRFDELGPFLLRLLKRESSTNNSHAA